MFILNKFGFSQGPYQNVNNVVNLITTETGFVLGGTAATVTAAPSGSDTWSNPSNALVDNSSAATCTGTRSSSQWLHITNFGFSIPSGATIIGLTIRARVRCSSTNDWYMRGARLVNSGTQLGTAKNDGGAGPASDPWNTWGTTASLKNYGGDSDLWSWTPVVATINSSTFGVQIWAEDDSTSSETASIECVWLNIKYSYTA